MAKKRDLRGEAGERFPTVAQIWVHYPASNCPNDWAGVPRNSDMWVWTATHSAPTSARANETVARPRRSNRLPSRSNPSESKTARPAALSRSGETIATNPVLPPAKIADCWPNLHPLRPHHLRAPGYKVVVGAEGDQVLGEERECRLVVDRTDAVGQPQEPSTDGIQVSSVGGSQHLHGVFPVGLPNFAAVINTSDCNFLALLTLALQYCVSPVPQRRPRHCYGNWQCAAVSS